MKWCLLACASLCAAQPVTIKTGTLIDGKGGVQRNVVVSVEGSKIAHIEPAGAAKSTYDLSALTLMPGWIDTHAHPNGARHEETESRHHICISRSLR